MDATANKAGASLNDSQRDWLKKLGEALGVSVGSSSSGRGAVSSGDMTSASLGLSSKVDAASQKEFERINRALDELIAKHQGA